MNRPWLPVLAATTLIAGSAHAEGRLLPVQGEIEAQLVSGSTRWTTGVYMDLSYVRELAPVGRGWLLFGGVGIADDAVTYWKRNDRIAPDAIAAIHSPGIEGRIGIVHGRQLGAPRIVVKATPLWARGVNEMGLPGERGLGLRASAGVAWPAWVLGRIDDDPPGTHSDNQTYPLRMLVAVFIPSEIEYVFMHVPGGNQHGVALGWSF